MATPASPINNRTYTRVRALIDFTSRHLTVLTNTVRSIILYAPFGYTLYYTANNKYDVRV